MPALESLDLWFPLPSAHWALLACQHVYVAFSPCNCSIRWVVKADGRRQMPLSMWKGRPMAGLQSWQGASLWLAVKRVQDNLLKSTMKQSKILSRDPQPLVTKGRMLKGICYNWCFGGHVHGFCLQRRWSHFRLHGSAWGRGVAGWSIPSGLMHQQLWGGTSGWCTTEQRRGASRGAWQGWVWPDGSVQGNVLESCLSCTWLLAH